MYSYVLSNRKKEASFRCLLPFYTNVVFVFLPLPSGVALLVSSQSHILFGRSFNFR